MTLLESLQKTGFVFFPTLNEGINNNIEIEIEGYTLTGNIEIRENKKFQEFTLLEVYDNDLCCEISFTKKESDAVNEWFQNKELYIE